MTPEIWYGRQFLEGGWTSILVTPPKWEERRREALLAEVLPMLTNLEHLVVDFLPPFFGGSPMEVARALLDHGRGTKLTRLQLFAPNGELTDDHVDYYAEILSNLPNLTQLCLNQFTAFTPTLLDAPVGLKNLISLTFHESSFPLYFADAPWTAPLRILTLFDSDSALDLPAFVRFLECFQSTLLRLELRAETVAVAFDLIINYDTFGPTDGIRWRKPHPHLEIDLPQLIVLVVTPLNGEIHSHFIFAFAGSPLRQLNLSSNNLLMEDLWDMLETFEETLECVSFETVWGIEEEVEEQITAVRDEVASHVRLYWETRGKSVSRLGWTVTRSGADGDACKFLSVKTSIEESAEVVKVAMLSLLLCCSRTRFLVDESLPVRLLLDVCSTVKLSCSLLHRHSSLLAPHSSLLAPLLRAWETPAIRLKQNQTAFLSPFPTASTISEGSTPFLREINRRVMAIASRDPVSLSSLQ